MLDFAALWASKGVVGFIWAREGVSKGVAGFKVAHACLSGGPTGFAVGLVVFAVACAVRAAGCAR